MALLYNVGCKLNQYEGYCLARCFPDDTIIVNTCCVTHEAEVKSLKKLRRAKRSFPEKNLIITGCLVHLRPELFTGYTTIDNEQRNSLINGVFPEVEKARYFLKIEDGCNQTCTFCVVARIRKRLWSKPIEEIRKEIEWARHLGFNEIVLVGANIGLYGLEAGGSLVDLFKELAKIPNLPRIRLSSLEPNFVNSELIAAMKDLPFCRHFHIPIQSGDDRILALMGRSYQVRHLKNIFELIVKNFTDVAIGADIIVGFPQETEEAFNNTFRLIADVPFTHLHIFTYSPRSITPAYNLGDPISPEEKKRRFWVLKELISEKNYRFRQQLLNKTLEAIIEKKGETLKGLTDNYIQVTIPDNLPQRVLKKIKICEVTRNETRGILISDA
ncbi:MAG: MiaB/RimO family radical SAM methylthiotransferase [candidate division WOR-3 bacterium]